MTPRQARVALGGFFLLAVGVTSNALYLQGTVEGIDKAAASPPAASPPPADRQRHAGASRTPEKAQHAAKPAIQPAGRTAAQSKAKLPVRPEAEPADQGAAEAPGEPSKAAKTVKVRMVRVATFAEAPAEQADAETIRAVQEQLKRRGYGPLAADGVMRAPTRAAIMAFEHDHHLALTGEASQELLKQLLFGTPPAKAAPSSPEVRSRHAEALIKQVQQLLAARGYRPGAIDGRLSAETVAALRTFETDQGLVPKGRIGVAVLERLQTGIAGGGRHPTR